MSIIQFVISSHPLLQESERKAYNPRSFCKVYQMDHQPLNTGEQKDMAEFFIDLVSKLEEMTPELKKLVKTLFCGVLSNNVVSLVSIIYEICGSYLAGNRDTRKLYVENANTIFSRNYSYKVSSIVFLSLICIDKIIKY